MSARSTEQDGTRRSALVTGAASGIGLALAEQLASRGVSVTLADRQRELAERAASSIRADGGTAAAVELDVRDAERFSEVVRRCTADAGRLDFLFNNAGVVVFGEVRDYDMSDWENTIDVNLKGVANGIQAAYPLMIDQGFGHIINTASMAGLVPGTLQGVYSATKHAIVALSRILRVEARRYGVKVSVVCPGVVRTPILHGGRYGSLKRSVDVSALAKHFDRLLPIEPNRLADRVLRAVDRNRAIIIEPKLGRLLWYLDRLLPGLAERAPINIPRADPGKPAA
jgi:NADP-dependent 3-hydroxy acid dehydrogenase YdfG